MNSTKPLPKGLIYELLPGTDVQLSSHLAAETFSGLLAGAPELRLLLSPSSCYPDADESISGFGSAEPPRFSREKRPRKTTNRETSRPIRALELGLQELEPTPASKEPNRETKGPRLHQRQLYFENARK